MQVGLSLIR